MVAVQDVHVGELSAVMARRGHVVTVFTRRDEPDGPQRVQDDLLQHMGVFAERLAEQWSVEPPEVVHAHSWISGIAAQLAARARKIPTVQTFHGLGVIKRRYQKEPAAGLGTRLKMEKLVARHANWVTATCSDEVNELTRMGRPRARASVVPCGVDLQKFNTEGPIAPRGERPRIIAVGKLLPRKGFDTMIRALPLIPEAEFVVVGGPEKKQIEANPEVRRLQALAADLGVADRVSFTGAVDRDDMPAMYRSADVVTCTPWYESFGIVALEAMACGVPVVASAVGGMLDTVVHDVTGRLVAPDRPRECAEAVATILRDSFLRRSLGLAGRDRACARYSWDRVADDTVRIYERLVAIGDGEQAPNKNLR